MVQRAQSLDHIRAMASSALAVKLGTLGKSIHHRRPQGSALLNCVGVGVGVST